MDLIGHLGSELRPSIFQVGYKAVFSLLPRFLSWGMVSAIVTLGLTVFYKQQLTKTE